MARDGQHEIQPVPVRQHTRGLPGLDERIKSYLSAIITAAEAEGLDDKAAYRIAFGFLKAYRPKIHTTLERTGRVARLT